MTLPAPAVYRFICPDGRSYVGSRADHRGRQRQGIAPHNPRLAAALAQYPAHTWAFEILQSWPKNGCRLWQLRLAEQSHIERLCTSDPQYGFNMTRAIRRDWHKLAEEDPAEEPPQPSHFPILRREKVDEAEIGRCPMEREVTTSRRLALPLSGVQFLT